MSSSRIQVVFLANDAVFDQALAFLESLRAFNPNIQLKMIPYADDIQRLESLREIYDFEILQYDYERWDTLSRRLFPGAAKKFAHRLRKLSIFDVVGEPVVYLDLDLVVLRNLDFLADAIEDGEADFICTAAGNDPWVYKSNYKQYEILSNAKRFSDGFFALRTGLLSAELAYNIVERNIEFYKNVKADDVYCQPMTNFIVDHSGMKVAEVYKIFPNISPQVWYATKNLTFEDGKVRAADGKAVLFVHWAGPVDMKQDFELKGLFTEYLEKAEARIRGRLD